MQEEVRRQLCEIVARYGRGLAEDPRRVRALLMDLCGEHRGEIRVLVLAVEERVASELVAPPPGVPLELLRARLIRRLMDNCMLNEEAAQWAAETWALALAATGASPKTTVPAPKPTPLPPKAVPPVPRPVPVVPKTAPPVHTLPRADYSVCEIGPLIEIPAGAFPMGSDKARDPQALNEELPQHWIALPRYWIGRTPTTVVQFQAFVQASGYRWEGNGERQGAGEHPVVWVNWLDAQAYCRWLTEQLHTAGDRLQVWRNGRLEPLSLQLADLVVRLPTEAEWEKAARGADERIYPWGDEKPNDRLCNFDDTVRATTPVGKYSPQGDSPYGCVDMAGNVWEWTQSLHKSYPYNALDGRENLQAADHRVLRGGTFSLSGRFTRCAFRRRIGPVDRSGSAGFRVAVCPIQPLEASQP